MALLHFSALGTGAAAALLAAQRLPPLEALVLGLTASAAIVDAARGILPNNLTVPAIAIAVADAAGRHSLPHSILGALVVAGPIGIVAGISRGRAIGWGDVKLLAALGAAFGPARGNAMLAGAAFVTCALGVVARVPRGTRLPFGPQLACAGFGVVFLSGDPGTP